MRSQYMKLGMLLLLIHFPLAGQELRGAWLSRNELTSRAKIASVMDSLANNNFNIAYVDAWSRGYPLFYSETFRRETGLVTDPNYSDRDVLQEAIIEGHRRGLEVEAWFEYGFVGGYTGYLPGTSGKGKIFDGHPDWVARKSDGTEKDASNFYWMTHTRPEVQQFLIGLCRDVAQNYDIDGIELDRIRYSGNVYGYDGYTDSVYRLSHGGSAPPATVTDAAWMRWRADILNAFMRAAYDSVKAVNKNVRLTNAPSSYGSSTYQAYNDNLQDWWQWVKTGSVDQVQVQMYVSSSAIFAGYINYILANLTQREKIAPSLALAPNAIAVPFDTLSKMVAYSRSKGFCGNAWWYFGDFTPASWAYMKSRFYPSASAAPGRLSGWRSPVLMITERDSLVLKIGTWRDTSFSGYASTVLITDTAGVSAIDYWGTMLSAGWYDVCVSIPSNSVLTTRAPYDLFDSAQSSKRVLLDQSKTSNAGWNLLRSMYLPAGAWRIVRVSNDNIGSGKKVAADAVMLIRNQRLNSASSITGCTPLEKPSTLPEGCILGNSYPNPFNPSTTITFNVLRRSSVSLKVFDVLGRHVETLLDKEEFDAGNYTRHWNAAGVAGGVYFARFENGATAGVIKLMLLK